MSNPRTIAAYLLLLMSIIATSIGCGMLVAPGAGLVALGVMSLIAAYLLGAD